MFVFHLIEMFLTSRKNIPQPIQTKAFKESNILKTLKEKSLTFRNNRQNFEYETFENRQNDPLEKNNELMEMKLQSHKQNSLVSSNKKSQSFFNLLISDIKLTERKNSPKAEILMKKNEMKNKENKGFLSKAFQKENIEPKFNKEILLKIKEFF